MKALKITIQALHFAVSLMTLVALGAVAVNASQQQEREEPDQVVLIAV